MPTEEERSLEELRSESEVTRAALTNTVRQLRDTLGDTATDVKSLLSPSNVTNELKTYVRGQREELYETAKQKITENPLQAMAAAAAVAYPLWGLARRMPIPLILIGAGYFLAKKNSASGPASTDRFKADTAASAPHISDAPSIVSDLERKAADTLDTATAKLKEGKDAVAAKIKEGRKAAADTATTAFDSASGAVSGAAGTAQDYATTARHFATDAFDQSRTRVADAFDKNPMAVAGIGLAIGAAIAALVPMSRLERQTLGPYREDLKDQAKDAAANAAAGLRSAAEQKIQQVSETFEREGFSPDKLKETASGMIDKAVSVAERGLETLTNESSSQSFADNPSPHNEFAGKS
jgi:hypothetical protein